MTNSPNSRVIDTEYVVMRREICETWDGDIIDGSWKVCGIAPTIDKCYSDVIGPAYPDDYDGITVFANRVRLTRRDPSNPHLQPYDEGAIFECLWLQSGGWRLGARIDSF